MPRKRGARDQDHDEKRDALLDSIGAHLIASLPNKPSLREFATAAGVTTPTLNHYFGTRKGVVQAAMERQSRLGRPYLAIVSQTSEPFEASINGLVRFILSGLIDAKVVDLHAAGVAEGVGSSELGPAYVVSLLEPTLGAVEARLALHVARGEMRGGDVRTAALALVSPLYLAALHQRSLRGASVRGMDLNAFAAGIAEAFVRGWSTDPARHDV